MPVFDLKNATIKIKDGASPTPNEISVKLGDGSLSYSEKNNITYRKDRGKLYSVHKGDEEPVDVSIDAIWEYLMAVSPNPPSIEDALKQRGVASSWVSTDAEGCNPYAVDIEIELTPICDSDDIETILLSDFRWEEIAHNAKEATLAVKGKCNVTQATVTRTAQ